MDLGDALTLFGLAVAWLMFQLGNARVRAREIEAATGLLGSVRSGMWEVATPAGHPDQNEQAPAVPWGELYFGTVYDRHTLDERAEQDNDIVMSVGYNQVFAVPTAPVEALLLSASAGDLINGRTVAAANVALWQLGVFNQLVQQQTDFNAQHLVELLDPNVTGAPRRALAAAARAHSRMLHGSGIGNAGSSEGWYGQLKASVNANIDELRDQRSRFWTTRWSVYVAALLVVASLALAGWQGIDERGDDSPKQLPPAPTKTNP